MEPPEKGKGKAKAGGGGGGGGSSSKPKASASSNEASTSQQGNGSTPPSASTVEAAGQATESALHWTQIKIPPAPTSGTPQEMQAARKERQRVRRLYEAARLQAGE